MLPCAASASSLITGDVKVIVTVIDGSFVEVTEIVQPSTATSYFSSLTFYNERNGKNYLFFSECLNMFERDLLHSNYTYKY